MNKILFRLGWSGGDHWYYRIGMTTPDGMHHMFEDGTLFTAGGRTSYASTTTEEALLSAEGRITLAMADEERRLKSAQDALATSAKLLNTLQQQRADLRAEGALISECVALVEKFFKGDLYKTRAWFKVPNPLLGEISPDDMIATHRTDKLHKFITGQLVDNEPPPTKG